MFDIIVQKTLNNGGSTNDVFDPSKQISSGYVVAMKGFEEIIPLSEFSPQKLEEYVEKYALIFKKHLEAKLGTWVFEDKVYLDISRVYTNKSFAISVAKLQGELAIFDLANLEEIKISYQSEESRLVARMEG